MDKQGQADGAAMRHPANPGPNARAVCVIVPEGLRLFILSLGAIEAIAASYPRANLVLAAEGGPNRLAEACPFIDSAETLSGIDFKRAKFDIVFDLASPAVSRGAFRTVGRRTVWCGLQDDAAIALSSQTPNGLLARLAHQLNVVGIAFSGPVPVPNFGWIGPHYDHAPRLQPAYFGLEDPYAFITLDGRTAPDPAAWGDEKYLALTRTVADLGLTPALVGEAADGSLAQSIVTEERRAINLVNRAETAQVINIASTARFAVGANTAGLSIAALFGKPGIVLQAATQHTVGDEKPVGAPYIQIYGERLSDISGELVCQAVMRSSLTNA